MTSRLLAALVLINVRAIAAYQCMQCIPGKYKSEVANNVCVQCPNDKYLNYSGADAWTDCDSCPANMNSPWGTSAITGCICNVGFYGPPGGPCAPCQTGTYAALTGQAVCTTCPAHQDSPLQSDEITDCACVMGYTGPNGGVCEQCANSTYKTTTGNHSCTSCVVNTMTLVTGSTNSDACICNPGYAEDLFSTFSTTVCARFISLTSKPAFTSISTRSNAAVGSAILPTYNALGGPNGKGHVSFDRTQSQYLDAGTRTLNFASNGGLTIVVVMRFTGAPGAWERVLEMGIMNNFGNNNFLIARYQTSTSLTIQFYNVANGRVLDVEIPSVIVQDSWLTIVVRYSASTKGYSISANGAVTNTGTLGTALVDRTLTHNFIGKSLYQDPYLNADIAGVFVVDEHLSTDATTAIANSMTQGVDMTNLCTKTCFDCVAGKYKPLPGPSECTNCAVNKYSTATAAIANTTCVSCPANTVSAIGSGVLTACKCDLGYTSPSGDGLACDACVQGTYKTGTGSVACTLCGPGKYSGAVAKTDAVCTDCLANENTNATGKVQRADCRCNPGYTGEDGTHCYACALGTYKTVLGPEDCTLCAQNRYSITPFSTTGANCLACPTSSQSPTGSSAKAACICNMGYTGPGGSLAADYVPAVSFTDLTSSCGVGMDQKCSCASSDVYPDRTCVKAIDDINTDASLFMALANVCAGNCAFGSSSVQPYIRIDFGRVVDVTSVTFIARTEWAPNDFDIFIGDSNLIQFNTLCATKLFFGTSTEYTSKSFNCIGRGRYIFILQGSSFSGNYMQFREMQVAGSIPEQNVACAACVAGTFKPTTGPAVCTNCLADTYSTAVAAISNPCVDCPLYTQSVEGSGAIAKCRCNAGYTGPDGVECAGCVAGKYKTSVGSVVCSNCDTDTFSTAVNKSDATCTTCLSVTTGPSQSLEGSALQTDCKCNMGYSGSDGMQCIPCPLGAFKPSVGNATCSMCPTNTYQPMLARTASTHCIGCPDNALSPQMSDQLTDCECKSGYLGDNGGDCTQCYAGKFKPEKGPQACDLCPNETYSGVFAATSDSVCAPCQNNSLSWAGSTVLTDCKCDSGFFTEHFGEPTAFCQTCGTGTYNTHLNATACSKCAAGLFSSAIGAKTGEVCHRCTIGFSGEGYAQCEACPPHATALTASSFQTDCKCDPGYTGDDGGTCEACAVGKFKPENGSISCTDCDFDTYLPYTGASNESQCLECAGNSITLSEGSDAVDDCKCNVGYTSLVAGRDGEGCTACAGGRYKNTTGHDLCALCPLHTYLNDTGSSLISQCQACFGDSVSDEGSYTIESCRCVGGFQREGTSY